MKKLVVFLRLELTGYEAEDLEGLSADSVGERVFQSDTVLQDLDIEGFNVEEE